jgi:hypothetical protein
MARKRKQWVYSPRSSKASRPALAAAVKAQVETKARDLLDEVLKPRYVKPPPEDERFNYVTDLILKWHGSSLYFIAVYACPGPNALSPSFESRFARMRHAGGGRFDLSFMRYTGEWVELYHGLTVEQCLESIRDDPWFTM